MGLQGAPVQAEGQEASPPAPHRCPWIWLTWERGTVGSRCPRSSAMISVEPSRSKGRWGRRGWKYGQESWGVGSSLGLGGVLGVQARAGRVPGVWARAEGGPRGDWARAEGIPGSPGGPGWS